jgi:tripartite-type tricarboxylate transporter receptor subunit TctC
MLVHDRRLAASAIGFAAALLVSGPLAAADYFAGRTLTVQVPSGSGGTYHVYCQIVQRNIARHIPGNPQTLIQNKPGGGGATSAAYMMNAAPKDGSYIAMIAPGAITVPLVRKVKYDATKFNWLGAVAARSSAVWIWHTHGIKTLDDLRKKEVTIATTGFASGGSVVPRLINQLLGTKMKLIYGYKGGGALNVAVERGETMGRWNFRSGFTGVRPTWLPEKKIVPIIATGPRDPELKGVPYMRDLLADGSTDQKLYDLVNMNFEVGQAFYAPPGTPKNVVDILRTAFKAMIKDPKTIAEIKQRRIEYSPVSAEDIVKKISTAFDGATPEVIGELKRVFTKQKS